MFKQKYFKKKVDWVLIMPALFLLLINSTFASSTFDVGYTSSSSYFCKDSLSGPNTAIDSLIQIVLLDSADGIIYGPSLSGSVATEHHEVLTSALGITNGDKMGYDTVGSSEPVQGQAGHFFHQRQATAPDNKWYIARVWNSLNTHFGESYPFQINFNFESSDINYQYFEEDILAILPKAAPVFTVNDITAEATRGSGSTSPSITVKGKTTLGTRFYEFEIYKGGTLYKKSSLGYKESHHTAYYNNSTTYNIDNTFVLSSGDDNQAYTYKVTLGNSFGLTTVEGTVFVPENQDPSTPWAVTDLKSEANDRSVTLTWSAPYDTDKTGTETSCYEYLINVSTEAIIDSPANPFNDKNTNPQKTTTWNNTKSVLDYFSTVSEIPSPGNFGTKQTITISNIATDETYYFAIKSKDAVGNESYISNITGVKIGEYKATEKTPETVTYKLVFSKDVGLGINTISIPFDPFNMVLENGASNLTLLGLIETINKQANANVVYSIGWWDITRMDAAGYEIKYSNSGVLNDFADITPTTGLGDLRQAPPNIIKDQPYQISVIEEKSFKLTGYR
ncbi:hypothetical protein A2230_02855 [candidate division WOR-1 bacterium RIFOXYA2_FULL_36_21]|uniref:Fibronectin type-III domain-containing protein n=1 Tax=candidate division WOR-1 bacterium RIFOXYB2_FULL_36_35 TaxID=1802578 RepID=A0A1F4S6I6_UNCSA|nr:MAG: hypothetical protein A2230_02855 [candidate division WOR-1 bacterium RIFOXYA2_FULL_36_21]OGC16048.1 MAG: hypothetical protein A2290_00185 [candidate division WOR-1 bacterium RIFOXYB2_FULL_36_35]OGC19876.1 MAG: hypothetical protein A2282_01665 [candidate division WOR-1 bacterium RIFOXYA12_FULL_36_13]